MTTKEALHGLIDELPEFVLSEVERYLTELRDDRMLQVLMSAPYDDEPTTPEEDEGAREAWEEYLQGKARPWEEVREKLAHE